MYNSSFSFVCVHFGATILARDARFLGSIEKARGPPSTGVGTIVMDRSEIDWLLPPFVDPVGQADSAG